MRLEIRHGQWRCREIIIGERKCQEAKITYIGLNYLAFSSIR